MCSSSTRPRWDAGERMVHTVDQTRREITCASLTTLELNPDGGHTKLKSTIQLVSFVGQDMVKGHESGTNASLDNLVNFFSNQTGR
jgi:hypothetical protein